MRSGSGSGSGLLRAFDLLDLLALARTVEQALSGLEAELGPMPPAQRILAYDSLPLGFAGGVVGTDISFMSSTPPSTRALSPDTSVLIHELTHLWSTADVPWLSEGFTDYFAFLVAAKLDRVPERIESMPAGRDQAVAR